MHFEIKELRHHKVEHFVAGTGKWLKVGLCRGHFLWNKEGENQGNDSTHRATLQCSTNGDVCGVTCNSLCLKSRLNFKLVGGHMGTCFSILIPFSISKICYNKFFSK